MSDKGTYIDLHLHTTMSDGAQTPKEVVLAAKESNMAAIAFTDHNYFTIYEPFRIDTLEIIPGCEFSTLYRTMTGKNVEVHIIGLFFSGIPKKLNHIFSTVDKNACTKAILQKLNDLNVHISLGELKERFPYANQLGRPHIADLLVEKGYAVDRDNAMDLWIGNYSPYYLNPADYVSYISMEDCVKKIIEYGGFPILAHPFHNHFSDAELEHWIAAFRKITDAPLGMEVYYQKYDNDQVAYLEQIAKRYHFFASASSDRHKKDMPFAKGEYRLLEEMRNA
jgi:hypothetical protein